jgi:hypothetical protein
MKKLQSATEWFKKYNAKTTQQMERYNRAGGAVRAPVRSASEGNQYDRGKFLSRKAGQALTANHPLKDEKGRPTPAAMQFKRWGSAIPKNEADLRKLKATGERLKAKHKPKS